MADDKKESTIFDSLSAALKENIGEIFLLHVLQSSKSGEGGRPTSENLDFIVRIAKKVTADQDNDYDGEGFVTNFYKMFDQLTGASQAQTIQEIAYAYYRRLKLISYFMKEYNNSKAGMKEKSDDASNIAIITMIDMVEKYDQGRGIEIVRNEFRRSGYMNPFEGPQSSEEVAAFEKMLKEHFKKEHGRIKSFFIIGFFCIIVLGFVAVCLDRVATLTKEGSDVGFLSVMLGDFFVISMILVLCTILLALKLTGSSLRAILQKIKPYAKKVWDESLNPKVLWTQVLAPLGRSIKRSSTSLFHTLTKNKFRRV